MSDVLIYKTKEEWDEITSASETIRNWEDDQSLKVPDDYKSFMVKYNGGYIYPPIFHHNIKNEAQWPWGEDALILDTLYEWKFVIEKHDADTMNLRRPKNTLAIGADPGGVEIIISLDEEIYGQEYLVHFHRDTDDDEAQMKLSLIAKSFRDFVFERLHDNSDKEGYDHWYVPVDKNLIKKVEF